jgi:hypothetical protein
MKKVSTKQNQRHIRLMKKRTRKTEIRKERREEVMAQMLIIKQSHKRIARTQKRMSKLAKQAAAAQQTRAL